MNVICAYQRYTELFKGVLPLSTNVDVILLLLGLKESLRVIVPNGRAYTELLDLWTSEFKLCYQIVSGDFVYIATSDRKLVEVANFDQSLLPHEMELGRLLGYPDCCSSKVAQVGEDGIDSFETWLVAQPFLGEFKLINPLGYTKGRAFISHVPCSTTCEASLIIAKKLFNFLVHHKDKDFIQPWLQIAEKNGSYF